MFRNVNDLSACFRSKKDPIPQFDNVNVVYKIPCTGCDSSYIGTTKRPLKLRLKEHTTDVYIVVYKPPDKWTALTTHA